MCEYVSNCVLLLIVYVKKGCKCDSLMLSLGLLERIYFKMLQVLNIPNKVSTAVFVFFFSSHRVLFSVSF